MYTSSSCISNGSISDGNNAAHNGGESNKTQVVNSSINTNDIKFNPHLWCDVKGNGGEAYPEHYIVPVMIYIGNQNS